MTQLTKGHMLNMQVLILLLKICVYSCNVATILKFYVAVLLNSDMLCAHINDNDNL